MESYLLLSMVALLLCAATTNQTDFIRGPTSHTTTLGSTAIFNCSVSTGTLGWLVDGSTLPELNTTDITALNAGDTSTLSIPATEEYNNTNVICSVSGRTVGYKESEHVMLRVQGLLAAVGGLEAYSGQTFILLTWTPPFSLDLTGIDPDLWYCVEVYNISSGETLLTNSSTVSEPRFNFTVTSPSPCDLFEFRVIPVNGAGNGNITSVSGTFFGEPDCGNASISVGVLSDTEMSVEIFCSQHLDICNSSVVATNQKTEAELSPKYDGTSFSVNVTNGTDGILFNYHYNATLVLMNSAGEDIIHESLSLFDVQQSTANKCSFPGKVNTSCTFAQNSRALGCLVILHPQNTSQTKMFAYAARDNSSAPTANISIHGVPKGNHTVLVFDGEQNGLLSTRAAAVQNVTVTEEGTDPAIIDLGVSASIREAGDNICVICSDTDDGESRDCVVIVVPFTRILEFVMSREIPRSGETCFPQEDGDYSVAVFRQSINNVLQTTPLTVSVVSICNSTSTTSSPVLSVTSPTTTPIDPVPLAVNAIASSVLTIAALVIIIAAVIMKKKNCKNYVTYDIESEKLSITSYQRAKKGKNKPLRVATDSGDMEQTSGLIYADLKAHPGKIEPPELDDRVQYSTILPPPMFTAPCAEHAPPQLPAKSHITNRRQRSSINLDNLFNELYPVTPKWKQLGEVIGIDDDLLDEIFTNNERDEECLRAVLEVWMKKSPTWGTVADSVQMIGEEQLAGSLYLKCVLPGMIESPPSSDGIAVEPACDPTPPEAQTPPVAQPPPHDPTPPVAQPHPHNPTPPVVEPPRDPTPPVVEPPRDPTPPVVQPLPRDPTPPVVELPRDPTPLVVEPPRYPTPPVVEPPPHDPTSVQHSPSEEEERGIMGAGEDSQNDGGVEQEKGEERMPTTPCQRHAVKGLNPPVQNAEESRKGTSFISMFSREEDEHSSIQTDESCSVAPHAEKLPGTFCDSFQLLRFSFIQKRQMYKDSYLTPAQITIQTSIVPIRVLEPNEISHSDDTDCSETVDERNDLYSSPIQCAGESDAATSECVGSVQIGSGEALQDGSEKDEQTTGEGSSIPTVSSSEYQKLDRWAIMKVCDEEKRCVQLEQLVQQALARKLPAVLKVSYSFCNNLDISSRPGVIIGVHSLRGKPDEVVCKAQPNQVEWVHSKKALSSNISLHIVTYLEACIQLLCSEHPSRYCSASVHIIKHSNILEQVRSAAVEKRMQLRGLRLKIQAKRVASQQLQAQPHNYDHKMVILVKSLHISNFLYNRILEKINGTKPDVSEQCKLAVWASSIPPIKQIIFYLKLKWFKGYNCLLKIKTDILNETTA